MRDDPSIRVWAAYNNSLVEQLGTGWHAGLPECQLHVQ